MCKVTLGTFGPRNKRKEKRTYSILNQNISDSLSDSAFSKITGFFLIVPFMEQIFFPTFLSESQPFVESLP